MNFQDFKYFLTLYKEKSFSSAAKKLFITQQGLSKAIRKLEQELTFPLFQRSHHGLELTPYGRALYPLALEFEDLHQRLNSQIARLQSDSQRVRVGVAMGVLLALEPASLDSLREAIAPCSLELTETTDFACEEAVENGSVDFGITVAPVDQDTFQEQPLLRRPMYAVINQDNPLSQCTQIHFEQLAGESFILASKQFKTYFNFVDRCRFHGFEPIIASTTMDQMVIYTQVLHRNWIGISADMPNIPLDYPGVSLVPFDLEEFPWQLSFIAAKSRAFSARDYLVQDAFVRLFA